jgi:hypothetical protein
MRLQWMVISGSDWTAHTRKQWMMEHIDEARNETLYGKSIEQFYANACWAMEAGATKDELIEQLEEAHQCVSDCKNDMQ